MEGKEVWAASELQADGAGREMDAVSISSDFSHREGKGSRAEGAGCETGAAGSARAVEQGWAQLCEQESALWEGQITLGAPQGFSVDGTDLGSLRVEEQSCVCVCGGSWSRALPARAGDPT